MIRALFVVWYWYLVWHPPAPVERAPLWDGRVLTRESVHVGVRPASDGFGDYAVTVQITVRDPF